MYDKKSNKRKLITIIYLFINGLFILIIINGNLAIIKKNLFRLIEGIKKPIGNISINPNRKKFYWDLYFDIYFKLIYFNEFIY